MGPGFTWSWTSISQAQRCSLAFFLSSQRLIGGGLLAPLTKDTEIGIAIHRTAKFLLEQQGSVSLVIPDQWNLPAVYFRNLARFVTVDLPRLMRLMGEGTRRLPELQIRLDHRLEPVYGWPNGMLVGALDLALYNPSTRSVIILDFKTGKVDSESLVSYYRPQLELYSFLFHRGYQPIERVGLVLYAAHSGEVHWLTQGLEPYNDGNAEQLLRAELTAALDNLSEIKPQLNELCRYCAFRHRCPSYEEAE